MRDQIAARPAEVARIESLKAMTSDFDSSTSAAAQPRRAGASGWLKVGIIAGASELAGGIAGAWWYRKTLIKLREDENPTAHPEFRNRDDAPAD
jgi:hypothetical protein